MLLNLLFRAEIVLECIVILASLLGLRVRSQPELLLKALLKGTQDLQIKLARLAALLLSQLPPFLVHGLLFLFLLFLMLLVKQLLKLSLVLLVAMVELVR